MLPALKYPANPPAVGDPETIYCRQALYLGFIAISGLSAIALGVTHASFKNNSKTKYVVPSAFAAVMAAAFMLMPPNPDAVTAPMDLVTGFRIASGATMTVFWLLLGVFNGVLWDRLKPNETARLRQY
jgi:predicted cobalt transporter CbtA